MNQAISATAVFPLGELRQAIFVQRDNRFRAEVLLDGQPV